MNYKKEQTNRESVYKQPMNLCFAARIFQKGMAAVAGLKKRSTFAQSKIKGD